MACNGLPTSASRPRFLAKSSSPSVPVIWMPCAWAQRRAAKSSSTTTAPGCAAASEITALSPAPRSHPAKNGDIGGVGTTSNRLPGFSNQSRAASMASSTRPISSTTACGTMAGSPRPTKSSSSPAFASTITGDALKTRITIGNLQNPSHRPLPETDSLPGVTGRLENPVVCVPPTPPHVPGSDRPPRKVWPPPSSVNMPKAPAAPVAGPTSRNPALRFPISCSDTSPTLHPTQAEMSSDL